MNDGESEAHTIRRIEAFSDIVIGFCLAEIGISTLPNVFANPAALWLSVNGFIGSFALIVVLWWLHHRLFATFFVLNRVTLVVNFTMLGCLALLVYFMQAALHVNASNGVERLLLQLWFACVAAVYAMLGVMYWIGLRARWGELRAVDRDWGLRRAINVSVATLVFIAVSVAAGIEHGPTLKLTLVAVAIASIGINRVLVPLLVRRYISAQA